jgi:hypothetical protein
VNQNLVARTISMLVLGILLAAYMNHDYQKWRSAGRDQFLAHEAQRFDRLISPARPLAARTIGTMIGVGFLVAVYEFVVFGISAFLKSMAPPQSPQVDNRGVPFS